MALTPWLVSAQALSSPSRPSNFSALLPKRELPPAPVTFEKNQGQFPASVRYVSRREGLTVAVLEAGVLFSVRSATGSVANVKMKLAGGNPTPVITGEIPASLKSHYLLGQNPADWTRDVASFQRVRVAAVYPGIDLVLHGAAGAPEFDFEVAPGADPSAIRYGLEGADRVSIDPSGDLVVQAAGQEFRQHKPALYQTIANHRLDVPGRFVSHAGGSVGFEVEAYDRSAALIIDPQMLFSKTFGTLGSVTAAFAFGPGDQLYIAGSLPGGALLDPQAPSQKQGPAKGTSAAFVASLDKAGNVLWITYLGGSDSDVAKSMVLDSSGAIYISGYTTSADFPVTARAFQKQTTSVIHAFAAKLDPTGANLLYSTILGATSGPACNVFAVSAVLDGSGGLVVAGYTNCASLPSRAAGGAQPYQKTFAGVYDGFLVKFNADASDLLFLTYLGGPGADTVAQMVKDSDGNFILTGSTQGPSFPTSGAGVITKYSGGLYDAFVTKLDSTGTALIFSTLLGGSGDDQAHSVAVTAQKEILVAGETRSRDFPMKGAVQPLFNGGVRDGFATKLNANGVLSISTYVGTAGDDYVATVAAQADGLVVMTVQTDSLIKSGLSGAPSLLSADNGHQVTLVAFSAEELQNQMKRYDFNFPADGSARNCGFFPITNPPDIAAGYLSYYCCAGSIYQNNQEVAAQSCLITSKNNSKGGIPDFLADQDGGHCCDPVSTATGEVTEAELDLPPSGPLSLHLERFYASQMNSNGFVGSLGTNWMHNFEQRLKVTASTAVVTLFPGRQIAFTGAGSVWAVAPTEKTNYQLQSTGGGFQFADPEELRIYTFTAGGQLTRIEDRNGNAITVTQSSAGPASVSDGLGRTITFTYDASGHLTSAKDQAGRTVQYFYTGLDLTLVSNVLGPFTRFQYATGGPPSLLSAKTYPGGNVPNRQQYDSSGKVVSQTADGGNTTTFTYAPGNATTVTDPLGSKFTQSHSDRGAMTSSVDHSGQATSMTYDSANHRTSTTNRLGATASVAYDPAGGAPALFTDPLGNVTAYTFITQAQNGFSYRLASQVTYADGSVRSLAYDARGNVLSITDPDGNKTQFAYDSHGWLTSATNPLGGVTTLVNNADGTLASAALPSGDTEKYAYDDRKRLVKTTRADGAQRSYTYNDLDQLLTTTNEAGDTQNSRFSLNNSLTAQSDYAGTYMTMFRDTQNRLAAITDPGGNNTLLAYDAAGRLKSSTSPSGFQMLRNYDAMGRTTSISDAAGPITSSVYDKEGRITTAVDGAGRAVNFTYDAAGNVTQVSNDAYSAVMDFDQLNRVTRVADGAGIATGYSYTRGGHVSAVNLGAIGVSLTYDAQGNVVTASDPNGKQWTLGRDSMGRMVSRKDPLGNTRTFEYDSRQRLSRINLPDGTVSFSFDGTGRLLSQTYSDDTQLKFTYAKNGLLLTANGAAFAYDSQHRLTNSNGITIARDVDGRIVSMTYGDGLTVTYSYNNRGMVSRVADSKGGGADLSYDAGNQLVTISRSNGVVTTLGVDSAGRTINIADGSLAAIKVTRDTAGKVIASDRSLPGTPAPAEGTVSLSYDDASQLTAGKYDGEGRLTSDGQRSYTWDLASRLVSYNGAGASTSFTYDANGMMLSSSGSGGTRQYVSNYVFGLPVIAIVRDGDNQDLRYYVPLPGGTPLYSIEAGDGSRRFFHYDEAGNTTFLTDDAGAVTDSYGITPYGESVTHTGPSDNPFTFQGAVGAMQVDSAGLYYMRARFYDGGSGRFLSRDPITRNTSPLSINPYQYAEGNPLAKGDPSGADALSQHALQQGKFFQWSAFEGAMSQYYIGQQVVLQVIKDAFADANASNASRLCFFSWCNRSYQDPAGLAASRLRSLLGSGYQLDVEGIYSPLPYINSVYHAASSGDLNGLARAYKSLFGTAATTMIGQDAEALIRQANGLNVRFGPLAGSNGINLGRDAAHWINHAMTGLVSHDGGSVISNDGGTVISNDGGTFTNLLMGLISQDGSGLISQDGGGLISQDGGGLISQDGGGVIGEHSSGFSFRIGR